PGPCDPEARRGPPAPPIEQPPGREREPEVSGAAALGVATAVVHAPDELGVEPAAGRKSESPAVHPPERDPPCPAGLERGRQLLRCLERVTRQTQRARQDTGAAAGNEPDRHRVAEAVQHPVEAAVTGKDADGAEIAPAAG